MTGRIFDIQRFGIHDGPGIRTTVFLKGCFLRCYWCHNPEGISYEPLLSFLPAKCIGCAECVEACPEAALRMEKKEEAACAALDRRQCTNCGDCAAVCDAGALQMVGRDVTVEEILSVVMRDRDYYEASGGGLTVSGGEPLFQPDFTEALLRAAKSEGLHCCLETSGCAGWSDLERMLPVVDMFLYDWKETNPRLHESFIGQSNEKIRANLRALHGAGASIVLRCPMIPEYNARREHLDGIVALARELPNLKGVDILPYHRLGRAKLERFGLVSQMPASVAPPDRETVKSWISYLGKRGVRMVSESNSAEAACKDFPHLCTTI